jgi:hypothetical protein
MRRRAASARAAGQTVEVGTDARVVAPNPEQEREQRGWERGYAIPAGQARARALSPAIPLTVAEIDLVAMTRGTGLARVDAVVDYFIHRFLRTRLNESRRQVLIDVLTRSVGSDTIDFGQSTLETSLRETLLVLMGMAEYQLS